MLDAATGSTRRGITADGLPFPSPSPGLPTAAGSRSCPPSPAHPAGRPHAGAGPVRALDDDATGTFLLGTDADGRSAWQGQGCGSLGAGGVADAAW